VLLPFILYAPCPFNAPFLFSVFQLLHTPPSTLLNPSQQQQPLSSLFYILIVSVQLVHAFSPCRVLCLIIIATLQLLWQLDPCVHHHWVLSRDSLAYLTVETLCLLYQSRANPLCCSYRLQHSSICQPPLRIIFIRLEDASSLFIFSGDHTEACLIPLEKSISRFWQSQSEVQQ
jgi:hypothetical protein